MDLSKLKREEVKIVDDDLAQTLAATIADYEQRAGKVLQPAHIERLLINTFAYREHLLRQRNVISLLISIELMLNAVMINFIAFARYRAEDATALAMIISELVQNAVEHGFADRSGTVDVAVERERHDVYDDRHDNGGERDAIRDLHRLSPSARTRLSSATDSPTSRGNSSASARRARASSGVQMGRTIW